MASTLTAVILTLNEEAHIADCIASVQWADHVLVFDSYSTDNTAEIAIASGAQLIQHRFENYAAQRNAALTVVDSQWVFFIDADERATPALAAEIGEALKKPQRGWWIPRENYIFGRLTKGAGWYPDFQLRLLCRESAQYDPIRAVHEEVRVNGATGYLNSPLTHFNYQNARQFHSKQRRYAAIEARIRYRSGMRPKPWSYVTMPIRQFYWRFLTLRGYIDGIHGLRLSLLMAYYEWITWIEIARLSQ